LVDWRIERVGTLASTNDEMLRRISARAARAGDVIVAHEQTAGRGRRGRAWVSERGGLWLTAALPIDRGPAGQMALVAAVAACEAARRWAPGVDVKWPNDLLLGGRKLGGILVEWPVGADLAAVGVGINVVRRPAAGALETLSAALSEGGDPAVTPEQLLPALLETLGSRWEEWRGGGWPSLLQSFASFDLSVGRRVRVEPGGVEGRAEGISGEGALLVRRDDGSLVSATAGEVVFTEIGVTR
jgi:BirA family biotin operon repressor/biotin-[acetyl-CoA-carboxylase] ligase